MTQSTATIAMGGGLNLITSPLKTPPGNVIAALNYEPVTGGYQRIRGYERFDGRPAPSAATYWRVNYTLGGFGTGVSPAIGDTLYNGAPDHFIVVAVIVTSGSFAGGDAAGYYIATTYTGTIAPGDVLFTAPSAGTNTSTAGTITLAYVFSAAEMIDTSALVLSAVGHVVPTISGDTLSFADGGVASGVLNFATEVGATYDVTLKILADPLGVGLSCSFGGVGFITTAGAGTFSTTLIAGAGTTALFITPGDFGSAVSVSLSSVSMKRRAANLMAISTTRTKIAAIPGSGPVRGVWYFNGEVLAFRDNAGGTAGVMFKASSTGWTVVANLIRIPFTCDTATQTLPLTKDHNNITGTSGGAAKGRIEVVVISSTVGTVNTGYLLVSGYTAGTFTAGAQGIWIATTATRIGTTSAAASTTVTIPPGGRYFFVNHNFYGSQDRSAMYMVNGVGKAMVYDGVGFTDITTGMTTDTPTRIAVHRQSLFLAFPGGSVQYSQVGEPQVFNPILGAGEIGVGSEIADFISANDTTLAILAKESINVLYGNDSSDYLIQTLTRDSGAFAYSAQRPGQVIYLDNAGFRSLSASMYYGNFRLQSVSEMIAPLINDFIRDNVRPVASFVIKRKNQYWCAFDNNVALCIYMGGKQAEILPIAFGKTVTCACSVEVSNIERIFFGADDGFVFEMEKGTSFDGAAIEHYLRLPFNAFGSPQQDKRVFKIQVSLSATGTTTLSVEAALDFGSVLGIPSQQFAVTTGGAAIDSLGSNELYYASQIETVAVVYVGAVARNFSLKIGGSTTNEEPHTLSDVTYHVAVRRLVR